MSESLPWLLLDVGNTAIKWRLAQAQGLLDQGGRTASDPQALSEALTGLRWSQAALTSVAGPSLDGEVIERLSEICDAPVRHGMAEVSRFGLTNAYQPPESIGADRWFAMLGAWYEHKGPLCVVDAGTAITIDIVTSDGHHEGGYIIPGVDLMRHSLTNDTRLIDVKALAAPSIAPGSDTAQCVNAGVWQAAQGAIQSVITQYPRHRLMLTGGTAPELIALGSEGEHRPHLVLDGLRVWLSSELDESAR
jgi:type III pantothenate kinase